MYSKARQLVRKPEQRQKATSHALLAESHAAPEPLADLERMNGGDILRLQNTIGNHAVQRMLNKEPISRNPGKALQRQVMKYSEFAKLVQHLLQVTHQDVASILSGEMGADDLKKRRGAMKLAAPTGSMQADLKTAYLDYQLNPKDLSRMINLHHAITFWQTLNQDTEWEIKLVPLLGEITSELKRDIQQQTSALEEANQGKKSAKGGFGGMFKSDNKGKVKPIPIPSQLADIGISEAWFSQAFQGQEDKIPALIAYYEAIKAGKFSWAQYQFAYLAKIDGIHLIRSLIISKLGQESTFDQFMENDGNTTSTTDNTLTVAEIAAIDAYSRGTFQNINAELRGYQFRAPTAKGMGSQRYNPLATQIINQRAGQLTTAQTLVSAFQKLPKFQGLTYRVVRNASETLLKSLQPGAMYSDMAFVSASPSMIGVTNFDVSGTVRACYFIIHTKSAVNISSLSEKVKEAEVLFSPGTRFQVKAVHQHVNGVVPSSAPVEAQMVLHQMGQKSGEQDAKKRLQNVRVVELVQV